MVVASTFPYGDKSVVPGFVKDQIISLKKLYPYLDFTVLAPHDRLAKAKSYTKHEYYEEYRFHYFVPRLESLTSQGIMPALKKNPLNYLLIPFLFFGEYLALRRLVKTTKPDLIYAHWFTPQAVVASIVGDKYKIPFVFTTHAADVAVWAKIPFGHLIVRNVTKKVTRLTAVSQRSMQKLERFFTQKEWSKISGKSRILPMGVDIPNAELDKNGTQPAKEILFLGRLAEKKGVHYLLSAFSDFALENSKAHLTIAGDGPWLEKLRRQAEKLKLGNRIAFTGYVSGEAKTKLIKKADVYIVPSIITKYGDAEGLPVSLMEGLAYGKICIATNESGADNVLKHTKDGYLIEGGNSEAIKEGLDWAFNLKGPERTKISQSAIKTAQQFSWQNISEQYFDFLLQ